MSKFDFFGGVLGSLWYVFMCCVNQLMGVLKLVFFLLPLSIFNLVDLSCALEVELFCVSLVML